VLYKCSNQYRSTYEVVVIVILIFMFTGDIQDQGSEERLFRPEREELTRGL
jgi:hypothetical protein